MLVLTSLAVMGSPGPSTMSVTAVGAAFGFRRALSYTAGATLGTVAVLLAVAAGLVAMLLSVPLLAPILLGISALYLARLAYKIATAPPLSAGGDVPAPSLAGGFLLGIANPKAYLAIAAVFAGSVLEPAGKTTILVAMIVLIHLVWLVAGTALSRFLRQPVLSRIINLLFAAILLGTSIMALVQL
jgi:threonine/homoserine/homoserine lactone efflux protein